MAGELDGGFVRRKGQAGCGAVRGHAGDVISSRKSGVDGGS